MTKPIHTATKRGQESRGKRLIHGGKGWLGSGSVPAGKEWCLLAARAIKREYIRDLVSDPSELTSGQIILLGLIERQLVYLLLVDSWIMEHGGPLTPAGEVQPAMGALYLSMANAISRNCNLLGLKRVSVADDLQSYIRRHDAEQAKAEK